MKILLKKTLIFLLSRQRYNRLSINFYQLKSFISNPHVYFVSRCNIQLFRVIYLKVFLFFQKNILHRKQHSLFKSLVLKTDIDILKEKGYYFLSEESNPYLKEIMNESNKLIKEISLNEIDWVSGEDYFKGVRNDKKSKSWKTPNKPQLNRNLFYDQLSKIDSESPFIKFALDENLLILIANYFGEIPRLDYAGIWMSKNPWQGLDKKTGYNLSSQKFHVDKEAFKTIKLFIFLNEWTETNGPLCFYDKNKSKKILNILGTTEDIYNNNIYDDQNIHQINKRKDFNILTGKPGTVVLLDTCSCFHYGSRINNDEKRFVFTLQYLPKHATVKTHDFSHLINSNFSELQNLCLTY